MSKTIETESIRSVVIASVMFIICVVAAILLATYVPKDWWNDWREESETMRNFGLGFAGFVAATFGLYLAWNRTRSATRQSVAALNQVKAGIQKETREARDSQEALYTKLFIDATDQLTDENIFARLGGIYALERIARESPKDHGPIMEILTAYVREEAPWPPKNDVESARKHPNADIQAILQVIGRRNVDHEPSTEQQILLHDLNNTNLQGSDMNGLNFERVSFRDSNLCGAGIRRSILRYCRLQRADLKFAHLDYSDISNSLAEGCDFSRASLCGVNLDNSDLRNAIFFNASVADLGNGIPKFPDVHVDGADLRGASGLSDEFMRASVGNAMER